MRLRRGRRHCMWKRSPTHFFLLFLPGWIEQSLAFPLLLLFHVVVHRIVVSILVHRCWHNPPTADRQRRLRRRRGPKQRRDVDRDRLVTTYQRLAHVYPAAATACCCCCWRLRASNSGVGAAATMLTAKFPGRRAV